MKFHSETKLKKVEKWRFERNTRQASSRYLTIFRKCFDIEIAAVLCTSVSSSV
jgi:hypothetical protein